MQHNRNSLRSVQRLISPALLLRLSGNTCRRRILVQDRNETSKVIDCNSLLGSLSNELLDQLESLSGCFRVADRRPHEREDHVPLGLRADNLLVLGGDENEPCSYLFRDGSGDRCRQTSKEVEGYVYLIAKRWLRDR